MDRSSVPFDTRERTFPRPIAWRVTTTHRSHCGAPSAVRLRSLGKIQKQRALVPAVDFKLSSLNQKERQQPLAHPCL